jgi:hypothetical protein
VSGAETGSSTSVDILSGNLFQCMQATLAKSSDPNKETYVCGSSNFDSSVITFAVAITVCLLVCMAVHTDTQNLMKRLLARPCGWSVRKDKESLEVGRDHSLALSQIVQPTAQISLTARPTLTDTRSSLFFSTQLSLSKLSLHALITELQLNVTAPIHLEKHSLNFLNFLSEASLCACVLCGFVVTVCLCAYICMKELSKGDTTTNLSTHYYQYAWVTTCAFMHGYIPASVVCLFVLVCMCVCRALMSVLNVRASTETGLRRDSSSQRAGTFSESRVSSRSPSEIQMNPISAAVVNDASRDTLKQAQYDADNTQTKMDDFSIPEQVVMVESSTRSQRMHLYVLVALMHIFNFFVTLIINFCYVFAIFEGVNRQTLLTLQICVSSIKLFWTRLIIPR